MNLNKEIKLSWDHFCILAGGIVLGFLIYLLSVQLSSIGIAWDALKQEKASLSLSKARLIVLQDIKRDYPSYEQRLDMAQSGMPQNPDEGTILGSIQKAANDANSSFTQVRFEAPVQGNGYTEIPLTVFFEGRYQQLVSLLHHLKNSNRATRVDEIKIGQGTAGLPTIQAEVSASAFYRGDIKKKDKK